MAVPPAVAPQAGFTAKLTAHGTKYYVNICAHPAIDRPIDAQDRPVSDDHLDSMGVDNLRVPLLSGVPRTVLLPGGAGGSPWARGGLAEHEPPRHNGGEARLTRSTQ